MGLTRSELTRLWKLRNPERVKSYYTPEKRRKWNLKKLYNITPEFVDQLWQDQNGRCKICGIKMVRKRHTLRSCHVDHNHKTNKVRALLCHRCNTGLGNFRENKQWLMNAIKYLE